MATDRLRQPGGGSAGCCGRAAHQLARVDQRACVRPDPDRFSGYDIRPVMALAAKVRALCEQEAAHPLGAVPAHNAALPRPLAPIGDSGSRRGHLLGRADTRPPNRRAARAVSLRQAGALRWWTQLLARWPETWPPDRVSSETAEVSSPASARIRELSHELLAQRRATKTYSRLSSSNGSPAKPP